jgi:CHAT domain-containing protein
MLDRAVAVLEAEAAASTAAAPAVDLAVAFYGRAVCLGQARDLVPAFAQLQQVLDRYPALAAARFDLALVLEELQLHFAAAAAWEDYLALDPSSDLARQARQLHARLSELGNADDRPADPCEEPLKTPPGGDTEQPPGPGWWQFSHARELVRDGDWQGALPAFEAAERALRATQSPLAGCATYYRAWASYKEAEYGAAYRTLEDGLAVPQVEGDGPVRARLLRFEGLIHQILGDVETALGRYRLAIAEAGPAAADALRADLESATAWALEDLGEGDAAWEHRQQALALVGKHSHYTFEETAEALRIQGHYDLALLYQDELVRRRSEESPELRVGSLWGRAEILHALALQAHAGGRKDRQSKHLARAQSDLEAAEVAVQEVADRSSREQYEADILRIRATIEIDRDPAGALQYLDEVIASMEATSYHYRLPIGYLSRARALRRLGRDREAEAALTSAVAEVERQRRLVDDPQRRAAFFDLRLSATAELVKLLADAGRYREAFAASEAGRTRALLEHRVDGGDPAKALDADEVAAALPRGLAVISYQVEEERLLAWTITATGFSGQQLALERDELSQRVEQIRSLLEEGRDEEMRRLSAALGQLLFEPLRPRLEGIQSLAVIPHGALHELPFAVLYGPQTGRYLVQDFALQTSPSASALVQALDDEQRREAPGQLTVLAVGDPAFDADLFPRLARLPAAVREVEAILPLYSPASVALLGADATANALRRAAPAADVLHLATHGWAARRHEESSMLLLAPGPEGDPGTLSASALFSLPLPRARLVVLSACSGGAGPLSESEGPLSLARPFLAAGVPAVIASLWRVDDVVTGWFMPRFHQRWQAGGDAAQALRAVQLELLSKPARPARDWAAFQLIGGAAPRL